MELAVKSLMTRTLPNKISKLWFAQKLKSIGSITMHKWGKVGGSLRSEA